MPIQVWTHPRADLNTMAGGRALAEGVASLGNLGDAIERAMEKKKQEAQLATVLRKKHSILQPDRKDEFQTMSLGDLIGEDKGFVAKAIEQDQAQERQVKQAQLAHYLEQQAQRQAQGRVAGNMQRILAPQMQRQPGDFPLNDQAFGDLVTQRTGLNPVGRALIEAAAAEGAPLAPGVLDDLIRSGAGQAEAGPLTFEEDPVTGNRYARQGKSVLPSGVNPAKQSTTADEMYDAEGNLIGHRVPTGGGKFTFRPIKPAASGELLPVLDPVTRQPVPGLGMDASGKVHDYRNIMQKSGIGTDKTAPAAAPASGAKWKFNPATGKLEPK